MFRATETQPKDILNGPAGYRANSGDLKKVQYRQRRNGHTSEPIVATHLPVVNLYMCLETEVVDFRSHE